jgi:hypothetical protein
MFFFNLGCIVSLLLSEFALALAGSPTSQEIYAEADTTADSSEGETLLSQSVSSSSMDHNQIVTNFRPYSLSFCVLVLVQFVFSIPLLMNLGEPWEEYNTRFDFFGHYQRFPLTYPLALGWGFLSLLALVACGVIYAFVPIVSDVLQFLGANVLLFLLVNTIAIQGFFGTTWFKKHNSEKDSWQLRTVGVSALTMGVTSLVIYMARSSRR